MTAPAEASAPNPTLAQQLALEEAARRTDELAVSSPSELSGPLQTEHGKTVIAEQVIQKIAGLTCREVPGVYGLGNAARRAISSITEKIPGQSSLAAAGGVAVQKGERQCVIELSVVVEYGLSIVDISQAIRRSVIGAVEHGTGLEVLEVNINVSDVHIPGDDRNADAGRLA